MDGPTSPKSGTAVPDWAKWGTIIAAASLLVTYLAAAYAIGWPPYASPAPAAHSTAAGGLPVNPGLIYATSPTTTVEPTTDPPTTEVTTSDVPTVAATTPVVAAGTFTDQEQSLRLRLDGSVFSTCSPYPSQEGVNVVAALSCVPVSSGLTGNVGVFQWTSADALERSIQQAVQNTPGSSYCSPGRAVVQWNKDGVVRGDKLCMTIPGEDQIVWSFQDFAIELSADGSAAAGGAETWWDGNGNCVQS